MSRGKAPHGHVRKVVKALEGRGWSFDRHGTGHPRLYEPGGGGRYVQLPSSPSTRDWPRHLRSRLRRMGYPDDAKEVR